MTDLAGKVALVTGAEVGIGRAAAVALAARGADIAVHYYSSENGASGVVGEITTLGRRALAFPADLTRRDEVVRTVCAAESAFGRIDILVNNAGGLIGRHPLVEIPEEFFHQVMDVNVLTAFLCTQAVVPGMIARKGGAIVNLTSLAAHNGGGPGASVYAAAKAAVLAAHQGVGAGACAARHPRERGVAGPHRRHAVPQHVHQARGLRGGGQDHPARARGRPGGRGAGHRLPRGRRLLLPGGRDGRSQRGDVHAMSRGTPRLRWFIITLISCATVINYIDRQTVSVLKTSISQDLGLSNADYAAIQNSFLVLYGISQMVSGRIYDCVGTRLGFIFSIIVWSFAAIMHATARSASTFRVCARRSRLRRGRQLAGCGEGGG